MKRPALLSPEPIKGKMFGQQIEEGGRRGNQPEYDVWLHNGLRLFPRSLARNAVVGMGKHLQAGHGNGLRTAFAQAVSTGRNLVQGIVDGSNLIKLRIDKPKGHVLIECIRAIVCEALLISASVCFGSPSLGFS